MSEDERVPVPDARSALEALIFASDGPATATEIRRALPEIAPARIPDLIEDINEQLEKSGRPYRIAHVAGGYRFRTCPEYREILIASRPERKLRLSRRANETLSVVAYRQPVTRPQIEDLRGVDCGAVLRTLLDRHLIRIVGRRDAQGRPVLYGTTAHFLETFGLATIGDLPTLRDVAPPEPNAAAGSPAVAAAPPLPGMEQGSEEGLHSDPHVGERDGDDREPEGEFAEGPEADLG